MSRQESSSIAPEILAYYARGQEDGRLLRGVGRLERYRTELLLERLLPPPPAVVLDVGGGTGHYALWLARRGYVVHLIDPVSIHLDQARAHAAAQPEAPLASLSEGEARSLTFEDASVDLVLLLGPLYHLPDRWDRLVAWRQAYRVLRPGGLVAAAVISRFASALDGLVSRFYADPRYGPTVWQDLRDGQHRPGPDTDYFTTAYLHRPEEAAAECAEAGFADAAVTAIEGPGWLLQDIDQQWQDPVLREALLEVIQRTESEPSLLGASSHLLVRGRRPPGR